MADFKVNLSVDVNAASIAAVQDKIKKIEDINIKIKNIQIDTAQLNSQMKQINSKLEGMSKSTLSKIDLGINTNKFQNELNSVEGKIKNLREVSTELKTNVDNLRTAFETMSSSDASVDDKVAAYNRWVEILPQVTTGLKQLAKAENEATKAQETITRSSTLSNKITTWLNNNTKAASVYGDELKQLQEILANNQDPTVLKDVSLRFAEITAKAKAAGLTTNSFAKSLKDVVLQAAGLGSAYMVLNKFVQIAKQGVDTIIGLDDALVDLKKTTTMSDSELNKFYYDSNEAAKEYGTTTQEMIQQAADWSRLGFSDKDTSIAMAKLSSQFAAISPGLDTEGAQEGLVSIVKAYNVATDDIKEDVMSKINIIGNNFATTNEQIVEGLEKSGSALSAMGQSLDDSIALFTAGQEILQDASAVATALRTMSLRVRGFDEDTEQLSDDLVNVTGEIVDLTKTASNPSGVSIFTDATQEHYKRFVEYFKDISEVWDDMSEKNQTALLDKLFGKRSAMLGSALIKNYSQVEAALETMGNAAGNADAEMSIIQESLTYKLNALKETGTGVFQNIFDRDAIGTAIELLTNLLGVIDKVTDTIGGLPAILTAVTAGLSFKNIGRDKMFSLA